jgi:hypothetical protein
MPPTPVKVIPLHIDEFWLASGISNKIHLYNLTEDSHQLIAEKLMEEPRQIEFFNPSQYQPPSIIFRTYEYFGYWVNNQLHTSKYSEINGLNGHRLLAKLSNERFVISSSKFGTLIALN